MQRLVGSERPSTSGDWLEQLRARVRVRESAMPPEEIAASRERHRLANLDREWRGMPYRPSPSCPRCQGSGWVQPRDMAGDILWDRIVPCPCYREAVRAWIDAGRPRRALGPAPHHPSERRPKAAQTFASWRPRLELQEGLIACREFAAGTSSRLWLALTGPVGCGKSHLAQAVTHEMRAAGRDAHYWSCPDLWRALRDDMDRPAGAGPGLLDNLKRADVLVLDQAADCRTDWERQQLEELLDWRYSEEARPTMLVADIGIESWPSERIKSRLGDAGMCRQVAVLAADYRPGVAR